MWSFHGFQSCESSTFSLWLSRSSRSAEESRTTSRPNWSLLTSILPENTCLRWKVELNPSVFSSAPLESWKTFIVSQKHPFYFPDGFGREWVTKTSGSGKERHWQQPFPACLVNHITGRWAGRSWKYIVSEGSPEIACFDTTSGRTQPQRRSTGGCSPSGAFGVL